MPYFMFFWDDETLEHIAQHGVSQEDFEYVVQNPTDNKTSRTTGNLIALGETTEGVYIACVYELIDGTYINPITAYSPEKK